ncbi:MAG: ATP-binding protein [Armatimonadetes bacterium]|nr:ATP-binding protein [Armatimonadota bacterium]
MSVVDFNAVTRVSVNGNSDYLPRVRRIVACIADNAGIDPREASIAEIVLSEACADAINAGASYGDGVLSITLKSSIDCIVADVAGCGACVEVENAAPSLSERLMRLFSEGVELIRHRAGLTLTLTKRTKAFKRMSAANPSAHHRN